MLRCSLNGFIGAQYQMAPDDTKYTPDTFKARIIWCPLCPKHGVQWTHSFFFDATLLMSWLLPLLILYGWVHLSWQRLPSMQRLLMNNSVENWHALPIFIYSRNRKMRMRVEKQIHRELQRSTMYDMNANRANIQIAVPANAICEIVTISRTYSCGKISVNNCEDKMKVPTVPRPTAHTYTPLYQPHNNRCRR